MKINFVLIISAVLGADNKNAASRVKELDF